MTYSPTELAEALGVPTPTDEQAAVICAPPGPLVVIAGAGAGKTETMAARVVWLVANGFAEPAQVLGLTFTRKAAGQLLRRVRSRLARLAGYLGAPRRRGRPDRQHLSRVRRDAAARIRAAAARRTRRPTAQRDRDVAAGLRRGPRPPRPAGHRQGPRQGHRHGAAAGRRARRAPGRHPPTARHPRRTRAPRPHPARRPLPARPRTQPVPAQHAGHPERTQPRWCR